MRSPLNKASISAIQNSVMVLSLDNEVYVAPGPHSSEMKSHLHNIRGGASGRNRWFDKGISLIVEPNGRAGMMGEHSPVDALVPSIVADYSLAQDVPSDTEWGSSLSGLAPSEVRTGFGRLDWEIDDYFSNEITRVEQDTCALLADSDDDVYWFTDYGCDWIKNEGPSF